MFHRARACGVRAARRGFTILELMVSLALIAIVASLAIPAWFERGEVTLENACLLLARDIRLAQNRAAILGETTVLEVGVDGDGYQVVDTRGEVVRHPRSGRLFFRAYSYDGVFEGVSVLDVQGPVGRRFRFSPDGRCLDGGVIELAFDGETKTVTIEEVTGFLRIQGSASGWRDDGS